MVDYGTIAGFQTYHIARGREAVVDAFDDDEIEAAKLIASEWLDANYRRVFPGLKTGGRDQLREWPRQGAIDIYGYPIPYAVIPTEVENATYEAALIELQESGSLTKSYTPSQYKRVSVDGAVAVEYASFASARDAQTQHKIIDDILSPLFGNAAVTPSPYSGSVYRA